MTIAIHYMKDGKKYKYTLGNDLPRSSFPITVGKEIVMMNKEKERLKVLEIVIDLHYPILKCILVQ